MFRTGQAKFLNDNHKKKKSKNQTIYDAIIDADFG